MEIYLVKVNSVNDCGMENEEIIAFAKHEDAIKEYRERYMNALEAEGFEDDIYTKEFYVNGSDNYTMDSDEIATARSIYFHAFEDGYPEINNVTVEFITTGLQ